MSERKHRLAIYVHKADDRYIATPRWRRDEIIGADVIAEGATEEECLIAVEKWIEDIPVYESLKRAYRSVKR